MPQPSAPEHDGGEQQANHRHLAEVAAQRRVGARVPDQLIEVRLSQIPAEQLQARVRRQRDVPEFQPEIPIDTGRQIESSSSHRQWPFVAGMKVEWYLLLTSAEGRFQ
jgi:hypothetical protein